jgi:monolysocardiolipin acyltransferase
MPEGRKAPWKFMPRPRQHLSVTFGAPIEPAQLANALASHPTPAVPPDDVNLEADQMPAAYRPMAWMAPQMSGVAPNEGVEKTRVENGDELATRTRAVRAAVTMVVQDSVEALGRRVSGNMLGKR